LKNFQGSDKKLLQVAYRPEKTTTLEKGTT
jgi:hypothetical protein